MASNQGLARLGFLADESQWGNQTRLSQDAQGRQVFLGHRGCPEELRLSQEDRYNTIATGWPRHDTCTAINNHVCRLNDPSDIDLPLTSRTHGAPPARRFRPRRPLLPPAMAHRTRAEEQFQCGLQHRTSDR